MVCGTKFSSFEESVDLDYALYNIWLLFSNRFYVSTWTHNCLRTSHVTLSKVQVPLFVSYSLNSCCSLVVYVNISGVRICSKISNVMPLLFIKCVASWCHILSTQGLRSREEEDKVSSYFLLKVCYYVSLDTLHLYVLSCNINQVEHHKLIINKYKQPILIMWSYEKCPKFYDNWHSLR